MSVLASLVLTAVVPVIAAVGIGAALIGTMKWVAEPRLVLSPSMEPALCPGDRVLTLKTRRARSGIRPGDVVVVLDPEQRSPRALIKRVVACGGSTVAMVEGTVLVNGSPAAVANSSREPNFGPKYVPPGSLFVLGDNLSLSRDSRAFGPLSCHAVLARAVAIYWPVRRIGLVTAAWDTESVVS